MTQESKIARAARFAVIGELKRRLFGLESQEALAAFERHARDLFAKYRDLGLTYVPAARMPAAVEELFQRLDLGRGQTLVEIGPGPHGGVGLIAAVLGLRVVLVESAQPFEVDVDALRRQLEGVPGSESTLAQIAGLYGTISVSQLDALRKLIEPFRLLIDAARGSIDIVSGDFADMAIQQRVAALGPFDHVVCTDVINPMQDILAMTTAATTTGEASKVDAILEGLAAIAGSATTLSIGLVAPEESDSVREEIARMYRRLDEALKRAGRSTRYERVIGPSSGSIQRCRLYRLGAG